MKRFVILIALFAGPLEAAESVTPHAGVATSSRYATQVAITVLREGGSAMDAATAAAFVIAVTRPDAAGIGGGGFLVYFDKSEDATWSVDLRETAPWSSEKAPGETPPEEDSRAIVSVGTPGFVAGLSEAHQRFGRTKWKDLLRPAIQLAAEGFVVDQALAGALKAARESQTLDQTAQATLLGDSNPGIPPDRIVQPDLAGTLARIAREPDDFYTGTTATKVVEFMGGAAGRLTIRDFREYQPIWRAPLRVSLGAYSIQTAPPPSRGGVAIASMLAILNAYDLADADFEATGMNHILAEAQRRATFDSRRVVGDPAYNRIAISSALSAERAEFWRTTIVADRATSTPSIVASAATPSDHTTHISVVDAYGNMASLTVSLSGSFGSGVMVPGTGILLNAALRDFTISEAPHPNAPEPRKRPATPVAPLIVFKEGRPLLAAGSSGGDAIASCLTELIVRIAKKGSRLGDAVNAPRIHQSDYPDRVSYEPELEQVAAQLARMGHEILRVPSIGEINAVMIDGDRIISISDPRGKGSSGGY